MKRLSRADSIAIGTLLFGLMFGAGNIIFPVMMGQNAGANYWPAAIGFLLTGVGLPVLAIISFSLSRKTTLYEYAGPIGKIPSLAFCVALLLTIGPLFAEPRTATVAFDVGVQPFLGKDVTLPLFIYSAIFFIVVLILAFRPSKILDVVGKFLAPLFIVLMGILLICCVVSPMGSPSSFEPKGPYVSRSFIQGILDGYNTMDILACLAFGCIIIDNIHMLGVKDAGSVARETGRSSITTLVIMCVLYIGLTYLGATSLGSMSAQETGGAILAKASNHYLGNVGQMLLAAIATVACLKTAIGLTVSLSDTFYNLFNGKVPLKAWTVLFVLASFGIANFGLMTIIQLSIPVLMFIYPLSITFIALWIINHFIPLKDAAFKICILFSCIAAIFDFLKATPEVISGNSSVQWFVGLPAKFLPLYEQGLGWIVPLCAGLIISFIFFRNGDKKEVAKDLEEKSA